MLEKLKKTDAFARNIIVVFAGASFANFLGLLCQLFIAHRFSPSDFAALNSLLSIYMMIAAPLGTLQPAIVKFICEYNARGEPAGVRYLLRGLLKRTVIFSFISLILLLLFSGRIMAALKIPSAYSILVFALLVSTAWFVPVFSGGIQGLELFGWVSAANVLGGAGKLLFAVTFVVLGYGVSGALGAFLVANVIIAFFSYLPLRRIFVPDGTPEKTDFRAMVRYLFPIGAAFFCFNALCGFDIVLVRWLFPAEESGYYSLAQMLGKIFLFLPGAVSIVMFPRTSGLNARNLETVSTLKRGLGYVILLGLAAVCFYNIFPSFVLNILTGKSYPQSVLLGRYFSVSMSLFAVLYIFINYFLSIKDLRFVKYLAVFVLLQIAAIYLFHPSLAAVQMILCAGAAILCLIHLRLAFRGKTEDGRRKMEDQ